MYSLPPFFERKNHFIQLLFLLFFVIGGIILFNLLGQLIARGIWGNSVLHSPTAGYVRFSQFFSTIGSFFIPALLFSYCAQKKFFTYSYAQILPTPKNWLIISILAVSLIPIISFFIYLNLKLKLPSDWAVVENWMQLMEEESQKLLLLITNDPRISILLLNLFICAALPAIGEEFFFRGTLQQLFNQWFKNKHVAIIVTAFLFSAIHLQFYGFIPRFLLGLYLGYLFVWTGSLWAPIFAHFLHNGISVGIQYFANQQGIEPEMNYLLTDELPMLIISIVISTVGIFLLWQLNHSKRIKN